MNTVETFMESLQMNKLDKVRLMLTLEEILLKYREKLEESGTFSYILMKRFGNVSCELRVMGPKFDILNPV